MRSVVDGPARILDAAFEALVEEGPGFPVSSVVRRAEVSKALVFHHFATREGLLDAMAARVLEETQAGLARLDEDYPNPRDRLAALGRTLLEDPRDLAASVRHVHQFWLQDDAEGNCRASLRDALVADYVAATLREGVATGALRNADAEDVAGLLLGRWHAATTLVATGRRVDFEREADRLASDLAALCFP